MIARAAMTAVLAVACTALAQQPAPPPTFAPPNLTPAGLRSLAATCGACHGTEGRAAPGSALGPLAGRRKGEIAGAMALFREGRRPATVMHQLAKGFTDPEIEALDDYFSQRKAP